MEINTKLEVLNNYFKEKEGQMQKYVFVIQLLRIFNYFCFIGKSVNTSHFGLLRKAKPHQPPNESDTCKKNYRTTSKQTTNVFKHICILKYFRQQNENLKQEIVNQEVELKSQISMLEKKNQENWVTNRQTERKLEEARQEAALLRNRLTLRERAIAESNNHISKLSVRHTVNH